MCGLCTKFPPHHRGAWTTRGGWQGCAHPTTTDRTSDEFQNHDLHLPPTRHPYGRHPSSSIFQVYIYCRASTLRKYPIITIQIDYCSAEQATFNRINPPSVRFSSQTSATKQLPQIRLQLQLQRCSNHKRRPTRSPTPYLLGTPSQPTFSPFLSTALRPNSSNSSTLRSNSSGQRSLSLPSSSPPAPPAAKAAEWTTTVRMLDLCALCLRWLPRPLAAFVLSALCSSTPTAPCALVPPCPLPDRS